MSAPGDKITIEHVMDGYIMDYGNGDKRVTQNAEQAVHWIRCFLDAWPKRELAADPDLLYSKEFQDVMETYRISGPPRTHVTDIYARFEDVKRWINEHYVLRT